MGNVFKNLLKPGEKFWNFREYLKNSLIFHSHSCRFHSCRFLIFMVDLPKHNQKWIELVIPEPNLIECDESEMR